MTVQKCEYINGNHFKVNWRSPDRFWKFLLCDTSFDLFWRELYKKQTESQKYPKVQLKNNRFWFFRSSGSRKDVIVFIFNSFTFHFLFVFHTEYSIWNKGVEKSISAEIGSRSLGGHCQSFEYFVMQYIIWFVLSRIITETHCITAKSKK